MSAEVVDRAAVMDVRRWTIVIAGGAYAAAIAAAEMLAAFVGAVPAAALDAVLLVALVAHYLLMGEGEAPRAAAVRARIFAALALVPLLRLSSLAVAPGDPLLFHIVSPSPSLHVGPDLSGLLPAQLGTVPLIIATVLAARVLALHGVLPLSELRARAQWGFAVAALVLAAVATPLLGLGMVADAQTAGGLVVTGILVFTATGVLEELVFRGIVQGALDPVVGSWSVPVANALFSATYLGSGSVGYIVLMCAFGMACGWWVRRTGSLAGAATGHGLLAVGLLLLWPGLL